MGRIFNRIPKKGDPLPLRGLARGLALIDYALTNMTVENGRVEWSPLGAPRIVFGDDGAGSSPQFIKTVQRAALPSGGEDAQVLQRNSDGDAVWGWVRYIVPEE
jgi:hypothetical protein